MPKVRRMNYVLISENIVRFCILYIGVWAAFWIAKKLLEVTKPLYNFIKYEPFLLFRMKMLTRNCFVLILSLSVLAFLLSIGAFLHHLFTYDEEVQAHKNTFTRTGKITHVKV